MTSPAGRTAIDKISDAAVVGLTELSPMLATYLGIPGWDDWLDDLSPDGLAARHQLAVQIRGQLAAAVPTGPNDDVARAVIAERLDVEIDRYETGWLDANLNVIASPVQELRMIFDLMPTETAHDHENIVRRMLSVPRALAGYRESLRLAAARRQVAAVRQIDKCADQSRAFAGLGDDDGYFSTLAAQLKVADAQRAHLESAAAGAESAYAELADFLTGELRPVAPEKDAVGPERYALSSREHLGAMLDLTDTYAWGWEEFLTVEAELLQVAERIAPGGGPAAAAAQLDADPRYLVQGRDGLTQWMQRLSDSAVVELGRTHFQIDPPLRKLECKIAPPGGGFGAYYTGPSDDLSRPGRMWWSVPADRDEFSTWRETTTVYHEGVPGHHLQIATAVYQRARLNDFQRLLAGTAGHAEGWALYAERLVRELGYLDDDGDLLGLLDSQLFRAARVVVDIGMHLELTIPRGTGFHEGERWTPDLALEFLLTRTLTDPPYARDEIDRYLGWPGQAPAYKVGERVWLAGRQNAQLRHKDSFDLKNFHTAALNMGGMGLDPLAAALDRL